jgi:hypothetical protein
LLACLLGPTTTPTLWTDYVANVICGDLPQLAVVKQADVVEICDATFLEVQKDCVLHFPHHNMPKYSGNDHQRLNTLGN